MATLLAAVLAAGLPAARAAAAGGPQPAGTARPAATAAPTATATLDGLQLRADTVPGGQTRLRIRHSGDSGHNGHSGQPAVTLLLPRDAEVPPLAPVAGVQLLARVGDSLLLIDRYRSRLNGGGGQCGAGEEQFVRLLRLQPPPAQALYSVKLASCWKDIEPDSEFGAAGGAKGLQWLPEQHELQIRWLLGPTRPGEAETLRLHIADDGRWQRLPP